MISHRELNGISDSFSTNAGLPNHCNNLSVGAASWPRFAPGGRRPYSLMQDLTIGEFQKYIELRSTFLFSQGEIDMQTESYATVRFTWAGLAVTFLAVVCL